jgi:RING finger protein 113A
LIAGPALSLSRELAGTHSIYHHRKYYVIPFGLYLALWCPLFPTRATQNCRSHITVHMAGSGEDAETGTSGTAPAVGFARRKNRGNIRKRVEEGAEDTAGPSSSLYEGEDSPLALRKAKAQKAGDKRLAFSTKSHGEDRLAPFKYESSRQLQQLGDQGATRTLETETEFDRDARALREAVLRQATDEAAAAVAADGTYKGLNNYVDYRKGFRREHTVAAEKTTGLHGPLRASLHARMSVRFDYQPDVCKDYKETGFCGFGDSCKFVHDRGDYKSGWELDRVRRTCLARWDRLRATARPTIVVAGERW